MKRWMSYLDLAGGRQYADTLAMMDGKLRALMSEMKNPMAPEAVFGARPSRLQRIVK